MLAILPNLIAYTLISYIIQILDLATYIIQSTEIGLIEIYYSDLDFFKTEAKGPASSFSYIVSRSYTLWYQSLKLKSVRIVRKVYLPA